MGEYGQTSLISVAVICLLAAQKRRSEPTQSGEATMSFRNGIKQPLADLQLLQPEMKETAGEPFLWTPLKTSSILEGDVPQEHTQKYLMTSCSFSL